MNSLFVAGPEDTSPVERLVVSFAAGYNPSTKELIELCGALHLAMLRENDREGYTELDYMPINFEIMQDSLVSASRRLAWANGEQV